MTMWVEGGAVVCKIRWIGIHVLQYEYVQSAARAAEDVWPQPKMSGRRSIDRNQSQSTSRSEMNISGAKSNLNPPKPYPFAEKSAATSWFDADSIHFAEASYAIESLVVKSADPARARRTRRR